MRHSNIPGLILMGHAFCLMAALVTLAWVQADLKEAQLPKSVQANTSVTASTMR